MLLGMMEGMEETIPYLAQAIGICGGMEGLIMEPTQQTLMPIWGLEVGALEAPLPSVELIGVLLQFHPKVELMFLAMVGILVMEVVIAPTVWEGEVMQEILQVVGLPHYRMLHQMVVMMGLLQIFMVAVQFMGTTLGVQQTPRERDLIHLVMGLAMERLTFWVKVLPDMLVVIVSLRDRQILVRANH